MYTFAGNKDCVIYLGVRFPLRACFVTHLWLLSPPDCEVVAEAADGGEERDHDDQDRDARGHGGVRDPLVRGICRGAVRQFP